MTTDRRELEDWERAECAALKKAIADYNSALPRDKRVTQEKLAEELGMAQGNLNGHLNGKRPLNKEIAVRIRNLLGIPVASYSQRLSDEILEMVAAVGPISVVETKQSAATKVLEMLKKHKSLSTEVRDQIVQVVEDTVAEVQSSNVVHADFSKSARAINGDILIPQYDVRGSMGHGQVSADYAEFLRNVVVSGVQLEKLGLEYTSPANLSIITGWGESMAPTIKSKDPVIVDRGVTEFIGDGVYVITWDDMLYIKRLQSAGDGKLELISDNDKHKDRIVSLGEVVIHARVLLVWNASRL